MISHARRLAILFVFAATPVLLPSGLASVNDLVAQESLPEVIVGSPDLTRDGCGQCENGDGFGDPIHQFVGDVISENHECSGGPAHYDHDCVEGDGAMWVPGLCNAAHDECFGMATALTLLDEAFELTAEELASAAAALGSLVDFDPVRFELRVLDCGGALVGFADIGS